VATTTAPPTQGTPVRFALLALLADAEGHGYELKLRFERAVGGVWTLNVGQVYDALRRLERDGLVEPVGEGADRRPYRATVQGRLIAEAWLDDAAADVPAARDEFAIRLLVARETSLRVFGELVQAQRSACMGRLQGLARARDAARSAGADAELALLDLMALRAEADARWLDLVEARAARAREGNDG
jgi:DNA-binding PadR family transcriptional regulator